MTHIHVVVIPEIHPARQANVIIHPAILSTVRFADDACTLCCQFTVEHIFVQMQIVLY